MEELIKGYGRLFETSVSEDDQGIEKGSKPSFVEYWGWYYTLDNLSNNDRTKWDFFLDMNVVAFLNTLAYYKDKQGYIEEQTQQQLRNARSRY